MTNFTRTYSGGVFYPLDPRIDDINITDIAHHLSQINRFTGATRVPYSVAQHSVLVSMILPDYLKLAGLLHDAAEAYCNDISTPIKYSVGMEGYRSIEARIDLAIRIKFGLTQLGADDIKTADRILLQAERRDLMKGSSVETEEDFPMIIDPWTPIRAETEFLSAFNHLTHFRRTQ